jgi:RNA polymerase sigma factor (TIGR02999 family)
MTDVTRILSAIEQGDARAAEQLLPLIYDELRKPAAEKMAAQKPGQTLEATALLHEAYLRLVGNGAGPQFNGRGQFFAAAAQAMRKILGDGDRRKRRTEHGAVDTASS